MRVKILETFIGFPDGVEKPDRTYTIGAVAEVSDEFGQSLIEKGHAIQIPAPGSSQPEDKNETH